MAKIYVADDNADVRNVLLYALVDEGHEVFALKDGESAMEALLAAPADVLVLDIMMPGLDGYQVLEQMGSWGILSATKVLVLSAKASDVDRQRALNLGASAFMSKPFDPDAMLETIDELLGVTKASATTALPPEGLDSQFMSELQSLLGDV
jgi:DNA-binding response OmpR family regulator